MAGVRGFVEGVLRGGCVPYIFHLLLLLADCHEGEQLCSTTLFHNALSYLMPKAIESENNGLNPLKP